MKFPALALSLLFISESHSDSRTSFGISLQPYKYKMAMDADLPMANADVLIKKDSKWYFAKFSWIGLYHESECIGCGPGAHTPNIDEMKLLRVGVSRRYLAKETGFSFFHEPGINLIRWYWRNSEFLQFIPGTTTYREDREEYGFIGLQPIEYGGMQWSYHGFLATFAIGIGANLGLNSHAKTEAVGESGRITVPMSIPDYSFISGDIVFGLGYCF